MDFDLEPYLPDGRFAIAFSGGGDSTALLHAVRARNPYVLIVDHGLRGGSNLEAKDALAFATSLGLDGQILTWVHDGIKTGLQAKARHARYTLMGEACRAQGITDLITGHTEDDQAETVLMRMDRHTGLRGAAGMARVVDAPIWPALAGVRVWRPLLGISRADIRRYLDAHKLPFVDDPSNENRDFTRIKVRDRLAADPDLRASMLALGVEARAGLEAERATLRSTMNNRFKIDPNGFIQMVFPVTSRFLTLCLEAVGGQGGMIARDKLARLSERLKTENHVTVTLAGCQIIKNDRDVIIIRNPGAVVARADKAAIPSRMRLTKGIPILWDGRWWITAHLDGLSVSPLQGHISALPAPIAAVVKDIPTKVRPTLPLIFKDTQPIAVGHGENPALVTLESAVLSRMKAALD
ncbi:tRNA lysidine(34) synthetase TilS [Fretibacter rubidus]|uniref:tRNA lysidine(34) synthetase TilS n=1 Tax=Fretibacter rubidus TaxID=570162 RepID=UPI00352B15CB